MNEDAPSTGRMAILYAAWLLLTTGFALVLVGDPGLRIVTLAVIAVGMLLGGIAISMLIESEYELFGVGVAFAALGVGSVLILAAAVVAVPGYHAAYGQRTDAVVTATHATEPGSDPSSCRAALTATERDIGWFPRDQCAPGDRIEVSVDPRGWVRTIPADQVATSRTRPVVVLVLLLAALGTVIAAITATVLDRRGRWR